MKHIEEHILELYVLGAERVRGQQEEIERHLGECAGCRLLAERMSEFYRTAGEELKELDEQPASAGKALARVSYPLDRLYQPEAPAIPLRRPSRIERTAYFVRQHPIVVGTGSFALMALAALALNLVAPTPAKDTNPSYVHYNFEVGMLQVFNKEDVKLWEKPAIGLRDEIEFEQLSTAKKTMITDLDCNGKNVVATTLLSRKDPWLRDRLSVVDGVGKVIFERMLDRPFQYLDRRYDPSFNAGALLADDFTGNGRKDILVIAHNNRSPRYILRLDATGKELGTYWHFGDIVGIYTVDLNRDRRKEIILCGQSDVDDMNHQEVPVIVVLDPTKITGDARSVTAPGFGFPPSTAELYYVRLPNSDMNAVMNVHQIVRSLRSMGDSTLHFDVWTGTPPDPSFEYIFSYEMKPLMVKSNDGTDRLHAQMVKEGKLTGKLDAAYLENLRSQVRYWDGEAWVSEPTKVKHRTQLTIVN